MLPMLWVKTRGGVWLGPAASGRTAEQIPRPYSHPATRKNHSRGRGPRYSRADDHPITRKTKTARAGGPDSNARSLRAHRNDVVGFFLSANLAPCHAGNDYFSPSRRTQLPFEDHAAAARLGLGHLQLNLALK